MSCENPKKPLHDGNSAKKKSKDDLIWPLCAIRVFIFAIILTALWISLPKYKTGNSNEASGSYYAKNTRPGDVRQSEYWHKKPRSANGFYEGSPDNGEYSGIDGVECVEYFQYHYDKKGRQIKTYYFRPHDYYENTWCLTYSIDYTYDNKGRLKKALNSNGYESEYYEYGKDGYTITKRRTNSKYEDTYIYDDRGCLLTAAVRNRYAQNHEHIYTYEYDDKGREIGRILKIGDRPAFRIMTREYDDLKMTMIEKYFNSDGKETIVKKFAYDENGKESDCSWWETDALPSDKSWQECSEYRKKGYWADYSGGLLTEELVNDINLDDIKTSYYYAYDYDFEQNLVTMLRMDERETTYLYIYKYNDRGMLDEEFHYQISSSVGEWTQTLSDGSKITIDYGEYREAEEGEDSLYVTVIGEDGAAHIVETGRVYDNTCIMRTAADGSITNRFLWGAPGGKGVYVQYTTSNDMIYWQTSPELIEILANKDKPMQNENDKPTARYHFVLQGECLWTIAEQYFGDGLEYWRIYNNNRDIIGDDPDIILFGMRLYIDG